MKLLFSFCIALQATLLALEPPTDSVPATVRAERLHEKIRSRPYPRAEHELCLNPPPLLVPAAGIRDAGLRFQLSRDPAFPAAATIASEPRPWNLFNAHRSLEPGTWHWRYQRIVRGKADEWSAPESFTVTDRTPRFAPPPAATFLAGIPRDHPRTLPFLRELARTARPEEIRAHPEFRMMEDRLKGAREAAAHPLAADAKAESTIDATAGHIRQLAKAWIVTKDAEFLKTMATLVEQLDRFEDPAIESGGDFCRAAWAEGVACALDYGRDQLPPARHDHFTARLTTLADREFRRHAGAEENHIFDNHFWQECFRAWLNANVVLLDESPAARQRLEYYYELWVARAPGTGFNSGGDSFYGTPYLNAELQTLFEVPALLGAYSGFDFYAHPWFREAGRGLLYSWPPDSLSDGFGDGHENTPKPFRGRVALADFLAREHQVPLAAWYVKECEASGSNLRSDPLMREYRILRGPRPESTPAPPLANAAFFADTGCADLFNHLARSPDRIFVSFRSSPFGSGSHTHSDQNSFNLHCGGRAVFRAAGHYFNFCDPHNLMSYRPTAAKNSVLVDGIGQPFSNDGYGWMARFSDSDGLAYCLGDASMAYRGPSTDPMWIDNFRKAGLEQSPANGFGPTPLRLFRRHLVLLRPSTVVIYDELAADQPVRFDWLLHSPLEMKPGEDGLTVHDESAGFTARLVQCSGGPLHPAITTGYRVPPDPSIARRKPAAPLPPVWNLTSSTERCQKAFILSVIEVAATGTPDLLRGENPGVVKSAGRTIEAGLDPAKPARLEIRDSSGRPILAYDASTKFATRISDRRNGQAFEVDLTDTPPRGSF